MQTRIVDKPAFTVAGLAVDTSQQKQADDAGPLAMRFYAPGFIGSLAGRVDPQATIAVHSNFNPEGETYRLMFGCEVDPNADQPDGVELFTVPAARYTVFTATGPQPQASIAAWEVINGWRGQDDVTRTGPVSFEIHDARARAATPEYDIYIPAVRG